MPRITPYRARAAHIRTVNPFAFASDLDLGDREDLLVWLQDIDPDGVYTDADRARDGLDPMPLSRATEHLAYSYQTAGDDPPFHFREDPRWLAAVATVEANQDGCWP